MLNCLEVVCDAHGGILRAIEVRCPVAGFSSSCGTCSTCSTACSPRRWGTIPAGRVRARRPRRGRAHWAFLLALSCPRREPSGTRAWSAGSQLPRLIAAALCAEVPQAAQPAADAPAAAHRRVKTTCRATRWRSAPGLKPAAGVPPLAAARSQTPPALLRCADL